MIRRLMRVAIAFAVLGVAMQLRTLGRRPRRIRTNSSGPAASGGSGSLPGRARTTQRAARAGQEAGPGVVVLSRAGRSGMSPGWGDLESEPFAQSLREMDPDAHSDLDQIRPTCP